MATVTVTVLEEGAIVRADGLYRLPERCVLAPLRKGMAQVIRQDGAYSHKIGVGDEVGRYVQCASVRADKDAGKW